MLEQLPPDDNAHPYPNAKNAVRFWEGSGGSKRISVLFWEGIRSRCSSVETAVTLLIPILQQSCPPHRKEDAEMLAKEMQTQDFRKYVAGKLGMM